MTATPESGTSPTGTPSQPSQADPLVSVIVPCFNDAEHLPTAVRSVLAQTVSELEVIVCDDGSTDGTDGVACALADEDPRVRYVRLPANSGSGAAPRNAGLRIARAPWILFLDSDDELVPDGLSRLLTAAADADAEVAVGRIGRLHVSEGRWSGWCTDLFERPRVTTSVADEPGRLFDTAAVGKLYSADFLTRTGLQFVPGLLYEDCLWTAQVYASLTRMVVVTEMVYVWKVDDSRERLSVSNDRRTLRNVRGRIRANALIDEWLRGAGHSELLAAKHAKFLRHDLRLYMGDLVDADDAWARTVVTEFRRYLAGIPQEALAALPYLDRVGVTLVDQEDLAGIRATYRAITRGEFTVAPAGELGKPLWSARPELGGAGTGARDDVASVHLWERPFLQRRIAHDLRAWQVDPDGSIRLVIRTWNALGLLPVGSAQVWIEVTPRGSVGATELFRGTITDVDESWFDARYELRERTFDRALEDERFSLAVVVRLEDLENVGTVVFPRPDGSVAGGWISASQGLAPDGHQGWVVPVRTLEATVALQYAPGRRPTGTPVSGSSPAEMARRATDAARKRLRRRTGPPLAVFCGADGASYSGNPKYIHRALDEIGWEGEAVWVRGRGGRGFPDSVNTVAKGSRSFYRVMGSAAFWIWDTEVPAHVRKPRGTICVLARDSAARSFAPLSASRPAPDCGPACLEGSLWDIALANRCPEGACQSQRAGAPTFLEHLGTPRLDVVVGARGPRRVDADRSVGIPTGASGLNVLVAPMCDPRRWTAGLAWEFGEAAAMVDGLGRLMVAPAARDRWRVPEDLSHLLVDIGRVPDNGLAMTAADVLLTTDLAAASEFLLLGRPVILYASEGRARERTECGFDAGPVASNPAEVRELLASLPEWAPRHVDAARQLVARWFPREDGAAANRVARAVLEHHRVH